MDRQLKPREVPSVLIGVSAHSKPRGKTVEKRGLFFCRDQKMLVDSPCIPESPDGGLDQHCIIPSLHRGSHLPHCSSGS